MTYTRIQFRKVSTFFYILAFLMLFNLYFNLNFQWFGVSLIVRVYLYVFSFFMIYIFSINNRSLVDSLRLRYIQKYGPKGELILQFENKIVPFLIIFGITTIYTLIDYIPEPNWPWNPMLRLIGGRYSNLVIYSLFLYFILNIKQKPGFAIGIFLVISIVYFFGDRMFYELFPMGKVILLYRVFKFALFFFILIYDFSEKTLDILRTCAISALCALIMYGAILGSYFIIHFASDDVYFAHKESGLTLAKLGFPLALQDLQKKMVVQKDVSALNPLASYGNYYRIPVALDDAQWQTLLFSGSMGKADTVALHMNTAGKSASYEMLIGYVQERIKNKDSVNTAQNFITMASRSIDGKEEEFIRKISVSGREMTIWGIQVLRESGSVSAMPFLMRHLFDVDERVSRESYRALKKISGLDPAKVMSVNENSPDVLLEFKKFYHQTRIPSR